MASKIVNNLGTASGQIKDSVLGVFGNKEAATKAAESVAEAGTKGRGVMGTAFSVTGRVISKPFRTAFNGGTYIATRPFVWADSIGGKVIGGVGNFFAKNPKTALAGTAVAAGFGIGHLLNKRAERHSHEQLGQLQEAQTQVANAQASAYTITPEEYATMQSRMRQSGQPGGQQFGEAVQAKRANPPQGDVVQAI